MPARSGSAPYSACPAPWPCPARRGRRGRRGRARAARARRRGRQADLALLTSSISVGASQSGSGPRSRAAARRLRLRRWRTRPMNPRIHPPHPDGFPDSSWESIRPGRPELELWGVCLVVVPGRLADGRPGALAGWLLALLAEPTLEPGDAAAGVEDLLLAGVERVAVRADIGVNLSVLRRAAGRKGAPARAGYLRHHIIRVNVALHVSPGSVGRRVAFGAARRGREPVPHLSALQCATSSTDRQARRFPPPWPTGREMIAGAGGREVGAACSWRRA